MVARVDAAAHGVFLHSLSDSFLLEEFFFLDFVRVSSRQLLFLSPALRVSGFLLNNCSGNNRAR